MNFIPQDREAILNPTRREYLLYISEAVVIGAFLGIGGKLTFEKYLEIKSFQNASGLTLYTAVSEIVKTQQEQEIIKVPQVPNRMSWLVEAKKRSIKPQKYDLSCEIKGLELLFLLNGIRAEEDHLIDLLPKDIDPSLGVHPNLKDVLNNKLERSRWGKLPPLPYGVHPQVLYKTFHPIVPRLLYTDTCAINSPFEFSDIEKEKKWSECLQGNLMAGMPTLYWYQACEGKRTMYSGYPVAEGEHVGVAIGYRPGSSGDMESVWTLNPYDLSIFEMSMEGLPDKALAVGGGMVAIWPNTQITQPA